MEQIMNNEKSSNQKINIKPTQQTKQTKDSLCEKLQMVINNLPKEELTLSEIRDLLGRDGMLLFIALLTIVFLIPVSIPGISTIFGATILLIGISMLFGWNIWLPSKFLQKELPAGKLRNGFNLGLKWFTRLEKISKPHRLVWLTENRTSEIINSSSIILAALLLMMPFGLIPFSNTLPAIALLFFAIGILQKDGVSILLGHLSNIATIIYFAILITGSGYAIHELLKYMNQ
ncbi:MAG: Exopolysaccharide synthesis ExoD [Ignavibacteria bacterium]|nr:MAG: Exopolysaccharide synthesis ExoD [Ignavibacteria bacterium]KAF0160591.1 MAG: Exopolysaccharide synthesis ExoD [Ignavibacteria bacterium]